MLNEKGTLKKKLKLKSWNRDKIKLNRDKMLTATSIGKSAFRKKCLSDRENSLTREKCFNIVSAS